MVARARYPESTELLRWLRRDACVGAVPDWDVDSDRCGVGGVFMIFGGGSDGGPIVPSLALGGIKSGDGSFGALLPLLLFR